MNYIFEKKRFNNIIKLVFLLIIVFLISPNLIFSQTIEQKKGNPPNPTAHHEIKDDDYVPVLRDNQGRSPAYNYSMSNIFTVQVNVDGNGQNIVGDAANEPSIAVDPVDPNRITIGWRQFNTITSNFRQAGYGFTTNGGQTWTFPGVIEPGVFRSDPVLDSDADGNIYYNSLTNDPVFMCDVFRSDDGGSTWDGGTFAQGGDKQ
ncbi:MAG: sialidase family protein, partial [Candidatus Kariarchaeaceae archaeon]